MGRINVNRRSDPFERAKTFIAKEKILGNKSYWDKRGLFDHNLSAGIFICSGKDWQYEAERYPDRYLELKDDEDIKEMLSYFEDE